MNLIDKEALIFSLVFSDDTGDMTCGQMAKVLGVINAAPSAQPELIRCKNCKHNQLPSTSGNADCEIFYGMTYRDGFCHMAERRTE